MIARCNKLFNVDVFETRGNRVGKFSETVST